MNYDKSLVQSMSPIKMVLQSLASQTRAHLSLPIVLACAYVFRLVIGLGNHSGKSTPPMYGDFEAQRHWMELTQHLPLSQWYFYDLQYWGLDYPPLTAYHSWLLGRLGSIINHKWFALDDSRGTETYDLTVYMRHSVIASELATHIPAVILFASLFTISTLDKTTNVLLLLLQPALLLVDHGHFQYNGVMLGFLVYSLYFLIKGRLNVGAVSFVLCLSFKQMGLYYAPAIFVFLLSKTIRSFAQFSRIGLVTIATFALCFGPFLVADGLTGLGQVVLRMFPFGRGLFEDKVANFWCALNVIYKLKRHLDSVLLQRMSLLITLASILPGNLLLFSRPTPRNLVLGAANSAWGFFLFSFQVHEKSILLPLMPSSLLIFGPEHFRPWIGWINIVASFSIWPLMKKDQLALQYFVFTAFWIWLGRFWTLPKDPNAMTMLTKCLHALTYIGIVLLHVLESLIQIQGKPDLWVVMNVLFCAPMFGVFYLWTIYQMTQESEMTM